MFVSGLYEDGGQLFPPCAPGVTTVYDPCFGGVKIFLPFVTSTCLPLSEATAILRICANVSSVMWWVTNGSLLGNGCVRDVFCRASCGTAFSVIGTSGFPVSRFRRYSQPVLLGSPIPFVPSWSKRTTGLGES